ncbi:MAG: hypothetical protein ACI88H_004204, partial [Cocleimonas sp.]
SSYLFFGPPFYETTFNSCTALVAVFIILSNTMN